MEVTRDLFIAIDDYARKRRADGDLIGWAWYADHILFFIPEDNVTEFPNELEGIEVRTMILPRPEYQ